MNEDIIYVDSYDFDERIEFGIVMVNFCSNQDVQCRAIEPIIEEIADQYYYNIRVLALDVEQSPDIANIFKIDILPTVIIFKNGKIASRIRGANPPSVYSEALDEILQDKEE